MTRHQDTTLKSFSIIIKNTNHRNCAKGEARHMQLWVIVRLLRVNRNGLLKTQYMSRDHPYILRLKVKIRWTGHKWPKKSMFLVMPPTLFDLCNSTNTQLTSNHRGSHTGRRINYLQFPLLLSTCPAVPFSGCRKALQFQTIQMEPVVTLVTTNHTFKVG